MAAGIGTPAAASCWTVRPAVAAIDPTAPLAVRYATRVQRTLWRENDDEVAEWSALLAALRADPATPPAMLAHTMSSLSNAMDAGTRLKEVTALAVEAHNIMQRNRLTADPVYWEILLHLSYAETNSGRSLEGLARGEAAMAAAAGIFGTDSWEYAAAARGAQYAAFGAGRYDDFAKYAVVTRRIAPRCLPPGDMRIARALGQYGTALAYTGRMEESIALDFEAASWAVANLDEAIPVQAGSLSHLLDGLATTLLNVGRYAEAEPVFRRAIDIQTRRTPEDYRLRGATLSKFGSTLNALGRTMEAEAMWLKSSEIFQKIPGQNSNPVEAAAPLRRAASAAQVRGDLPLALARRRAALAAMPAAAVDHPERAAAQLELANTLLLTGALEEAKALAEPARAVIATKLTENDARRFGSDMIAAVVAARTAGVAVGYRQAQPLLQRLESKVLDTATSRGDLLAYAPRLAYVSSAIVALALEAGDDETAFRALQLTNLSTLALVSNDRAVAAAASDPAQAALVGKLQDLVRNRRQGDRERSAALARDNKGAATRLAEELASLDREIGSTSETLDRQYPNYRAVARPAPVTLASFRQRLAPGEVLVAPLQLEIEGGSLTILVTSDGLKWSRSAGAGTEVPALVERIRASVAQGASRRFDAAAAHRLYDVLFPTALRPLLSARKSLLYYANGALLTIPPALLVTNMRDRARLRYLIDSHDMRVLPTLAPAPTGLTTDRPRRFLGIGAPLLAGGGRAGSGLVLRGTSVETGGLANLPPLPGARAELEEMARILGGTENLVLTGGAATKSALVKLPLSRFNIITFATHGLRPIEVGARTEPALLLTPDALRNDDGLLTASNIASLRLDADWVILSACDSAGGIAAGAPAYSGLATAFLQAGARALLVSHWPVRDDAAARLTVRTVASNAPSRAAALRHAMLTLRRDKSVPGHTHPATWAPFVLIDREPAAGTERADRLQMLFPQCADVRFGDQALRSRLSATGPLSAIRVSTIHQCCSKRRLKLSAVQEP